MTATEVTSFVIDAMRRDRVRRHRYLAPTFCSPNAPVYKCRRGRDHGHEPGNVRLLDGALETASISALPESRS